MGILYENEIVKEILKEKPLEKSLENIIQGFEEKLENNNFIKKSIEISEYFGEDMGVIYAKNKLLENNIIMKDWLDINGDFKGLYIFIHDNNPFYFGISRRVIKRVLQHIKGFDHFQATLAFNMGLIYYKLINKDDYKGTRKDFDFNKYVDPMKEYLLKQKIAFININDGDELALFEIYCSIKYKTILNSFETH